jgi:hypothetical protein
MKLEYKLLLAFIVCFLGLTTFAQDEKTTTKHAEEDFTLDTMPKNTLKKKYNYTIRAQEEKTQLIKVCFHASTIIQLLASPNIIPYAAFERKMATEWSYLVGGGISLGPNGRLDAAVRYYYGLNHRIKRGKSVNNFSANYFSIQGSGVYDTNFESRAHLLYGVQRRINKWLFIDVNAGAYYDNFANDINDVHAVINAHFGLVF